MKESVQCSLTTAIDYIRKNLKKYKFIKNLDDYLEKNFKNGFMFMLHLHLHQKMDLVLAVHSLQLLFQEY